MTAIGWALACAVVAGALGWWMPLLVARLPERYPDEPPTYATLAASHRLSGWLAGVSAAVGAALGWARAGEADLPAFLVLGVLGVVMGYVDLRRRLLPDVLTVAALLAGALLLAVAALVEASLDSTVDSAQAWSDYARAWAWAGALLLGYLLMVVIYPAGIGLGDVKLAAALGLYLGWLSWSAPVVGTVAGFLVGGLIAAGLLATRRANRRTGIPFGPSMLLGALVAVVWAEPIAAWYLGTGA